MGCELVQQSVKVKLNIEGVEDDVSWFHFGNAGVWGIGFICWFGSSSVGEALKLDDR